MVIEQVVSQIEKVVVGCHCLDPFNWAVESIILNGAEERQAIYVHKTTILSNTCDLVIEERGGGLFIIKMQHTWVPEVQIDSCER